MTDRRLTCQGLDSGPLKEPCRAVFIVPVIHVPAVVDIAVLLLDLNVVIVCGYCGCHLELSQAFFHISSFSELCEKEKRELNYIYKAHSLSRLLLHVQICLLEPKLALHFTSASYL